MRVNILHAGLWVFSRSCWRADTDMPLFALEKTKSAWNQSTNGVLLLLKIVPAVGEILKRHLEHWNLRRFCLPLFIKEYVPPQEQVRLCIASNINSIHASSVGNCLRRLVIPYLLFFICPKYIPRHYPVKG